MAVSQYSVMDNTPFVVAILRFSADTLGFIWGLWSSEIWVDDAAAGSPDPLKLPIQNSLPGRALPSQAYETTRSFPMNFKKQNINIKNSVRVTWIVGVVVIIIIKISSEIKCTEHKKDRG